MAPIRHEYDQELENLRQELMTMGNAVNKAIADAVASLVEKDAALAQRVIVGDDAIDDMEITVEDRCMLLIARQQPLAKDLRMIGASLKVSTDLERIGDHACNIAEVSMELASEALIKPLIDLPRMSDMVRKMLTDALQAYMTQDIVLAEQVCVADDDIDALCSQMFRELLTYMLEDQHNISQAAKLILISRYLERIADHATNIAEWLIYLVTGRRIRKK